MTYKRIILLLNICILFNIQAISQDLCKDIRIFDGSEPILKYGMDTTQNWWFTTEPVKGRVRLNINGKETGIYNSISQLRFSPDGNRWAVYATYNTTLNILSNDTILKFSTGTPSEIVFSGNSQTFVFSYKKTDIETIHTLSGKFDIMNRTGRLFTDYTGYKAACVGKRGSSFVVNNNGVESDYYEAIKPIGFWSDGSFLYAAKSGNGWELFKDNKSISLIYKEIVEFKINLEGTVAAIVVKNNANKYQAILFSDEYYEPVVGKPYDGISNLALHPHIALYAYNAFEGVRSYVVFNSSEYSGTKYTSKPLFSSSGDELYFIGCDIDCFVSVNGKRYDVSNSVDVSQNIVIAPGTETIAYTTSSSLVVKSLTSKNLNAGMMVDSITKPRYNWRSQKYEALGMINNKLYLLTCRPK